MTDREEIRRIEELSLNAWPALRQMTIDGWLLRFAEGYTRRSNSVQPLYPGTRELRDKIEASAAYYVRHRLPATFKMTAAAEPSELDSVLEQAGFALTAPTSVQVSPIGAVATNGSSSITCSDRPTEPWLNAMARFTSITESHKEQLSRIVNLIVPEANFGAVVEDGQMLAGGLAVREGTWVGLFDVATAPQQRRRGYARRLINGLLGWARSGGATHAYLQVTLDNLPALRLYESLGFRERYQYWYRQRAT